MYQKKIALFSIVALLGIFSFVGIYSADFNGQTSDESYYISTGFDALSTGSYHFLGEHPPFIAQWGSLPLVLFGMNFPHLNPVFNPDGSTDLAKTGLKFLYESGNDPEKMLFLSRAMIVILGILLGVIVYFWAKELGGEVTGIIALSFFCFSPNMLAHSSLYTTDLGISLFFTATFYFCYRFLKTFFLRDLILTGLSLGFALVSKLNALVAIPSIAILFLVALFFSEKKVKGIPTKSLSVRAQKWILALSVALLVLCWGQKLISVTLGVILLSGMFLLLKGLQKEMPLICYRVLKVFNYVGWFVSFVSALFLYRKMGWTTAFLFMFFVAISYFVTFSQILWKNSKEKEHVCFSFAFLFLVASLVIIFTYVDFPYQIYRVNPFKNFLFNVSLSLSHAQNDHFSCFGGSFITCDWRYFPALFFVKTPLVTLFFFFAGIFLMCKKKNSLISRVNFFLPYVIYLLVALFVSKVFIGIRHLLPFYPFVFIVAGYGVVEATTAFKSKIVRYVFRGIFVVLGSLHLVNWYSIMPNYISYFNLAIGGVAEGANYTSDSNVNWGQDNKALAKWVVTHNIPMITIASLTINSQLYQYYKMSWKPMRDDQWLNPDPGYYAIDVGLYHQLPENSVFRKLSKITTVGTTYFVFKQPH